MALLLLSALRAGRTASARLALSRPAVRWLSAAPEDPEDDEERMDELLEISSVRMSFAPPDDRQRRRLTSSSNWVAGDALVHPDVVQRLPAAGLHRHCPLPLRSPGEIPARDP